MSIIVHNPCIRIQLLLLDPHSSLAVRPQPNSMSNHTQSRNALAVRNLRAHVNDALHDADRNVGVRLRLPVAHVVGPAEDGAAAAGAHHQVRLLGGPVVVAGEDEHGRALVADEDGLAARGRHGLVRDAAELEGAEARRVDDDGGRLAGVAELLGLVDVGEDGALEDDAVLEALADEPWEVDGGVDADCRVFAA